MKTITALLITGLSSLIVVSPAWSETHLIKADSTGDYPTIQVAVDSAAVGDTVLLADGTYQGDGNFDIQVTKAITIRSQSGNPDSCVVDCRGAFRAGFQFLPSGTAKAGEEAALENIGIREGAGEIGAGVFCYRRSPTITGCKITSCVAVWGAGIAAIECSPVIRGCTIRDCFGVKMGGGIWLDNALFRGDLPTPVVDSCTIVNNMLIGIAKKGAAFPDSPLFPAGERKQFLPYFVGGSGICVHGPMAATITNCTIQDNKLVPFDDNGRFVGGAGVSCQSTDLVQGASVTIENCDIRNNEITLEVPGKGGFEFRPSGGGGIFLSASSPTIQGCAIKGNTVDLSYLLPPDKAGGTRASPFGKGAPRDTPFVPGGGGILSWLDCSPMIVDCEVDSNLVDIYGIAAKGDTIPVPVAGGGISCQFQGTPTVKGCKIRNNVVRGPLIEFGRRMGGGGVFFLEVMGKVQDCTVTENEVTFIPYSLEDSKQGLGNFYSLGGGLCLVGGPYLLDGCTVMDNRAFWGGGLYIEGQEVLPNKGAAQGLLHCSIQNTIVARNLAFVGGGIVQPYGVLGIGNSTISGNGAKQAGGFVQYNLWGSQEGPDPIAEVVFNRSILWGNCAKLDYGDIEAYIDQSAHFFCSDVNKSQVDADGGVLYDENTIFTDPMFCCPVDCEIALVAAEMGTWPVWPTANYHIDYFSPCRMANSPCGKQIGALGMGCRGNRCEPFGPGPIGEREIATVEDLVEGRHVFALHPPVPNPFNPVTEIQFSIPSGSEPSRVTLHVYNSLGQKVRTLVNDETAGGIHRAVWDGTDEGGTEVASGVYFCRLVWNGSSETRRGLVVLK